MKYVCLLLYNEKKNSIMSQNIFQYCILHMDLSSIKFLNNIKEHERFKIIFYSGLKWMINYYLASF
jgi:hypothetical protein